MSKVLIVDDSNTQCEIIAELLQKSGISIDIATNGVEALEKVNSGHPDLVVLDIIMPEMNGYEVCRKIKGDDQTKNIPVVMCSTKSEEFDRYWGMTNGADAYISKPFHPNDLIGTVKQLLRGSVSSFI
ncbi:MAG TPA: response regulator [Allocoleopsis sp.]